MPHFNSEKYWEERYTKKGNSGSGSYGKLALFKSSILNNFVKKYQIHSTVEFGCGDGNQLAMLESCCYTGYDISHKAIKICKELFQNDNTKNFHHVSEYGGEKYDLSLSLDVIFHLIEDSVYKDYIDTLFSSSNRFVIVYSSNNENMISDAKHVKHRYFLKDIPKDFFLLKTVKNQYPYNTKKKKTTSFSDFYIFEKR